MRKYSKHIKDEKVYPWLERLVRDAQLKGLGDTTKHLKELTAEQQIEVLKNVLVCCKKKNFFEFFF